MSVERVARWALVGIAIVGLAAGGALDLDRRPPLVQLGDVTDEAPQWPSWLHYVYATISIVRP